MGKFDEHTWGISVSAISLEDGDMNIDQLHELARAIDEELLQTEPLTEQLRAALERLVSSPAEPTYQAQVAEAREALQTWLETAPSNTFPPAYLSWMTELRIEFLVATDLAAAIDQCFDGTDLTPSTAHNSVAEISASIEIAHRHLAAIRTAFESFSVGDGSLLPNDYEVGVQIPRGEVDNSLEGLGREFGQLNRILGAFIELTDGSPPPIEVRTISSSDFSVYLQMLPGAAAALAYALDKVLDLYKKYLDIRVIKDQMVANEVSPDVVAALDADTTTKFEEGLEEIVSDTIREFARETVAPPDPEIEVKVRFAVSDIASRVDAGYTIQVRVAENAAPDDQAEEPAPDDHFREIVSSRQRHFTYTTLPGKKILSLKPGGDAAPDA